MSNLLKNGLQKLQTVLAGNAAVTVQYRRGEQTVSVAAIPGQTATEVADTEGINVCSQVQDWLIAYTDLAYQGQQWEPKQTDQVVYDGMVFDVIEVPGDGTWRFTDMYSRMMRIHTQFGGAA